MFSQGTTVGDFPWKCDPQASQNRAFGLHFETLWCHWADPGRVFCAPCGLDPTSSVTGRELRLILQLLNFFWVFFTRLLVQMGVYTVQEFLQYYMRDCVPLPEGMASGVAEAAATDPAMAGGGQPSLYAL